MKLDKSNDLMNNAKENNSIQNFMKELSNHLKKSITNNNKIDCRFSNVNADDLTLYGEKIIAKYKNKILIGRTEILQKHGEKMKEKGEMYYIYAKNSSDINSYNLCVCKIGESHKVITKSINELPEGTSLGSVLIKQGVEFVLDIEATKAVAEEINTMINDKIKEQNEYLESKRIEGHTYKVGEKYSDRVWLYDLDNKINGAMEGIEEITFPHEIYQEAKEGDLFIYQNGKYEKIKID